MKKLSTIITIIAVLGIATLAYMKLQSNKEIIDAKANTKEEIVTTLPVRTASAEVKSKSNELLLTGSFVANKEMSIFAEGQGRITELYISEGQSVSKGQKIAKLDDASIQAQLRTAQAQLDKIENDIKSYTRLLEAGAVASSQLDEIILSKSTAIANIAAISQQLSYTTAYAPLSGIITQVPVEKGSFANPGSIIGTVVDISQLKMIIKVPEEDVVKLDIGRKVEIVADVYPDHIYQGVISLIGIQADEGRKYDVELNINNMSNYKLKPGMYGEVRLPLSLSQTTALYIPRRSIIGSLKDPLVYVSQNGRAVLKPVQTGEVEGENIIILSGLVEGEQVITAGQLGLKDGAQIRLVSTAASQDKIGLTN